MTNENMQSPEDEWITTFDGNIKLNIDWDKKRVKGAEVRGVYVKYKDFTREVWNAVGEMIHRSRLAYEFAGAEDED